MYICFSHQIDAPCLHVQECFISVSPALENVFLYNDIQYTACAQGEEARVLFVFSFS